MFESLASSDPEIFASVRAEFRRQQEGIELIASENYVSEAVMVTLGTPLTNKYAEGLPNRRYYGGCEFVDQVEVVARNRAREIFGAVGVNVQPHSGAHAGINCGLANLVGKEIHVVETGGAAQHHLSHRKLCTVSHKLRPHDAALGWPDMLLQPLH